MEGRAGGKYMDCREKYVREEKGKGRKLKKTKKAKNENVKEFETLKKEEGRQIRRVIKVKREE